MKSESGTRGQNEFAAWCEPEQFHIQHSQPDRLGWDFMLEADPDRVPDLPLDQQHDLPKFLIQVKATEHATTVPRIKLSALKHLVDADLPAAIAILFYSKGGRRSVRRLIVPVDEPMIEDTLRRVREQEASGNRGIHNVKVPIPIERAIEIGQDGEGLSDALHSMIDGPISEYVARKSHFRKTCGFDNEQAVAHFYVPGLDPDQSLREFFGGGRRAVEVKHFTINRRRFGIPLGNDKLYFRDAILEMEAPPLLSGSVELLSDRGEWLAFSVDVAVTPPFSRDQEQSPIRIANSFFEMVLNFDSGVAEMTFDYGTSREVELEEATQIVQFGAILARKNKTLTVHLAGKKLELPAADVQGPFVTGSRLRHFCAD